MISNIICKVYGLISYFITLIVCVFPIVFMQSFLGQFSSTGFISVFRIAPLFKGIGYVSLAINLTTLTYYSVFAAIPLFYFAHSLRPTIPWSCQGMDKWLNLNRTLTSVCVENRTEIEESTLAIVPSVEFFRAHINIIDDLDEEQREGVFSWELMIFTFIVWALVALVLTKPLEKIGKYARYSCLIIIGSMSVCLLRLAFLPGAFAGLQDFFKPEIRLFRHGWILSYIMAFSALGPGWGSILTMASYNKFKTNIYRYSWLVCLAQVGITLGLAFMTIFVENFVTRNDSNHVYYNSIDTQWMDLLVIPTGLTFLELPHFWSLLFFGMVSLGSLNVLIVQLFSVLTSLFDEYEILRTLKKEVSLASVGVLSVASIFFCSNHGIDFLQRLVKFSIMTQMALNFLLLMIVLWVYGRERFQRDLDFMINHRYSTWMVNIVRFVAPAFIFLNWFLGFVLSIDMDYRSYTWFSFYIVLVIGLVPWLLIPGYCVYKIMQTSGELGMRLRRSVRPTDWYPVESLDRQRYEVTFSNTEHSLQLTTEGDEQI